VNAVVDAFHIDAKEPIEILFGGRFDGTDMRDACIVDQNVDASSGEELLEGFADVSLIGDVASMDGRLAANIEDLLRGGLRLLRVDVQDSHRGAVGGEFQSNGLTDTASRAGNNRNFAIQPEIAGSTRRVAQRETPRFQGMKSS